MAQLADIIARSRTLEAQSRAAYVACVKRFELFRPNPATWTPMAVEAWRDALLAKGLTPQTVNKHLYALRYAAKRREALGLGHDFARAAEPAKAYRQVGKREALDADEVAAILGTTARGTPVDLRDRALIVVGVKTGLRASALAAVRWDEIYGRKLKVREKGGHERVVILDDECLAALASWKKAHPRGHGPVFVAMKGEKKGRRPLAQDALTRQAVHRIVVERAQEAGIRHVHPHLLRHTFASWALAAGVPPQRVMVMTGHKSLATLSGYVTDLEAERDPVGAHLPKILKKEKP